MTSGVSLSLLSCWTALLASICACLLSQLPTRKEKGKCYLKCMLATPSEYVTCSFACPVSFSASVQPHFALFNCFSSSCLALSLAPSLEPDFSLFSSCLVLSLAPSLEPDFSLFSCFSSSCLSLSLTPSLKPFLLALILFTIHLEYRWITNTHFELGFLSTSEMSTVLSTKESNHSNIHCHMQKNETHAPFPCRMVYVQKMRCMRRCYAGRRSMTDRRSPRRHH